MRRRRRIQHSDSVLGKVHFVDLYKSHQVEFDSAIQQPSGLAPIFNSMKELHGHAG